MNSLSLTHKINRYLLLLAALLISLVAGYGIDATVKDKSRRNVLQATKNVALVAISGATAIVTSSASANAVNELAACPPRSQNCIRTTWTAPSGTQDVTGKALELFKSYPIKGQSDIDKGGWTIIKDGSDDGTIRLEFKSGIGNFAKFFNGGKPFVDDVSVLVTGNTIDIRSSSRIGDSDLSVNQKRLQYLATKAREIGWDAPDPKY